MRLRTGWEFPYRYGDLVSEFQRPEAPLLLEKGGSSKTTRRNPETKAQPTIGQAVPTILPQMNANEPSQKILG